VLVLRDVLDYPAREVAEIIETTEQSVHSMLKRARATLSSKLRRGTEPERETPTDEQRELVERLTNAFGAGDVNRLVELMTDDVWVRMPPLPLEYQGPELAREFFTTVAFRDGRRYRMVPTGANKQPAFGAYILDPTSGNAHAMGLLVLDVRSGRVGAITRFDVAMLQYFGLPRSL
jgi:RNA polymerase sigma-70 factor (ECF subfamily)